MRPRIRNYVRPLVVGYTCSLYSGVRVFMDEANGDVLVNGALSANEVAIKSRTRVSAVVELVDADLAFLVMPP